MLFFSYTAIGVEHGCIFFGYVSMMNAYLHIRPLLIALVLRHFFFYGFWLVGVYS